MYFCSPKFLLEKNRRKVALAVGLVLAILGLHVPCLGFRRSQGISGWDFFDMQEILMDRLD